MQTSSSSSNPKGDRKARVYGLKISNITSAHLPGSLRSTGSCRRDEAKIASRGRVPSSSQWAPSTSLLRRRCVRERIVTCTGGSRREVPRPRGAKPLSRYGGGERGAKMVYISNGELQGLRRPPLACEVRTGFLPSSPGGPAFPKSPGPAPRQPSVPEPAGGGRGPGGDDGAGCPAPSPPF